MNSRLATAVLLGVLGSVPALAQRPKHPFKAGKPSPVSVTRSTILRVTIAMSPMGVFDYLSDATKLTRWFPNQAIFEPKIGGKYHFRWYDTEGLWSGVVTEFIRGSRLAFTWQPPGEPYETNVRMGLLPQGNDTMIELTHSGFTSVESLDKAIEAWRFYLENLKSVIETGVDLREKVPTTHSSAPARTRRRAAPKTSH